MAADPPQPVAADPQPVVVADPRPIAAAPRPIAANPPHPVAADPSQPVVAAASHLAAAAEPRTAFADPQQQPITADPRPMVAVGLGAAAAEGLASEISATGEGQSPAALRLLQDYLSGLLLGLSLVDSHPLLGGHHSTTLTSPAGAGGFLPLQMPNPSPASPAPLAAGSSAGSSSFRGEGHDGDHGFLAVLALSSILLGVGSRFLRSSYDIAKLSSSPQLAIERPG